MKTFLTLLFACVAACVAARAQTAQSNPELAEAERLNAQMFKLFRAGQVDEALPLARRVVEIREKALGGEHLLVANALNNLGSVYLAQKKEKEAESAVRRAFQIAEKVGGPAQPLLVEIHTQLAVLDSRDADLDGAEKHLESALSIAEALRGPDHRSTISTRLTLAEVNYQQLNSGEAERHLSKAVEIVLKQPRANDARTAERIKRFWCLRTEVEPKPELDELMWKALDWLEGREQPAGGEQLMRVESHALNSRAKSRAVPNYPGKAKGDRVQGRVVVQVVVDEAGKVVEAKPLCGHEALTEAAVKAVNQWRFNPTLVSGQPVKVTGQVTVHFSLQ